MFTESNNQLQWVQQWGPASHSGRILEVLEGGSVLLKLNLIKKIDLLMIYLFIFKLKKICVTIQLLLDISL